MTSGGRRCYSGLAQAFYRLLLEVSKDADETLSGEQCYRLLAQEVDATSLALLETASPGVTWPRKDAQPNVEAEFPIDSAGGTDAVAVDATSVVAVPAAPQVARSVSFSSSLHESSRKSSSSSPSRGESPAPIGAEAEPAHADVGGGSADLEPWHWRSHVLGQPVRVEMNRDCTMGMWASCNNHEHGPKYRQYRSFQIDTDVFGARAPVFYLGAWLCAGGRGVACHAPDVGTSAGGGRRWQG